MHYVSEELSCATKRLSNVTDIKGFAVHYVSEELSCATKRLSNVTDIKGYAVHYVSEELSCATKRLSNVSQNYDTKYVWDSQASSQQQIMNSWL